MSKKKDRLGEISYSNLGTKMEIVEYNSNINIKVQLSSQGMIHCKKSTYLNFKKGSIYSPYDKTTYGKGYIGLGKYSVMKGGVSTKQYKAWHSMMARCYDGIHSIKFPTYSNCIVCEEWHNFQNFGEWFDENYYSLGCEKMQLDKDILLKGNKVYSDNTCVFVNNHINSLFLSCKNKRGKYMIGVYFSDRYDKFISQCRNAITGKRENFGFFDTEIDAFNAYKKYKEGHIKEVADYYKTQIPSSLYRAMYNYKVEASD